MTVLQYTFEEALMLNLHPDAEFEWLYNKLVANSL